MQRDQAKRIEPTAPEAETNRRIRLVPFGKEVVELIAEALGVEVRLAPFRLPGGAVYQMLVPGASDRPAALVTLWPSIRRVDAIGGGATVVLTQVASATLVDGVEVMFRRATGECLIVARGGKLIVRS